MVSKVWGWNSTSVKLSYETNFSNGDFAIATNRALRGNYGLHNRPTTQVNDKIVKKFEEY